MYGPGEQTGRHLECTIVRRSACEEIIKKPSTGNWAEMLRTQRPDQHALETRCDGVPHYNKWRARLTLRELLNVGETRPVASPYLDFPRLGLEAPGGPGSPKGALEGRGLRGQGGASRSQGLQRPQRTLPGPPRHELQKGKSYLLHGISFVANYVSLVGVSQAMAPHQRRLLRT